MINQPSPFESALILTREDNLSLRSFFPEYRIQLSLLLRGSTHGFSSQTFHERVDNRVGPSLILVKTEYNKLFGAFTSIVWKRPSQNTDI